MAKTYSERDLVTVDDFFALVQDGQKADLIVGVIYRASPDSTRNDQLGGFIRFLVQGGTRESNGLERCSGPGSRSN